MKILEFPYNIPKTSETSDSSDSCIIYCKNSVASSIRKHLLAVFGSNSTAFYI